MLKLMNSGNIIMAGMVVVVCIDYLIELYGRWDDLSETDKKKTIASISTETLATFPCAFSWRSSLTTCAV